MKIYMEEQNLIFFFYEIVWEHRRQPYNEKTRKF